jgi:hypothetical protein
MEQHGWWSFWISDQYKNNDVKVTPRIIHTTFNFKLLSSFWKKELYMSANQITLLTLVAMFIIICSDEIYKRNIFLKFVSTWPNNFGEDITLYNSKDGWKVMISPLPFDKEWLTFSHKERIDLQWYNVNISDTFIITKVYV